MGAIAFNDKIYPEGSPTAADSVYDNSLTGLPANVQGAVDQTTGNISSLDTVELTATAAHAHAVGSTFLFIGQFVKTTSAIAAGDTITLNGNVVATNICAILSELNSNLPKYTLVVDNIQHQAGWTKVYDVSVPAHYGYFITMNASYDHSAPAGAALDYFNDLSHLFSRLAFTEEAASCSYFGLNDTDNPFVVYCWGKWNSEATDPYSVYIALWPLNIS